MNRLQLYITMASKTYQDKVEVNPDSNVHRAVVDLSQELANIEYDKTKKNIFYMLKYARDGFFVAVVRTIPPEAGANVSAWIYIPYAADISDHEIAAIVETVANKVGASSMEKKDIADLRKLFAREYDDLPDAITFNPSGKAGYAFRNYGTGTHVSIADLVGEYRFQKKFEPFTGVFLIDADITTETSLPSLNNTPLQSMSEILAPPQPAPKNDLPSRKKIYRFQIPTKSADIGSVIEFEISTAADLNDSPIDGYEATSAIQEGAGHSNHLMYNADNSMRKIISRIIFALAGCVVGFILGWIIFGTSSNPKADVNPTTTTETAAANPTPTDTTATEQGLQPGATADATQKVTAQDQNIDLSLEAAIKYLDGNQTWKKAELEAFPDLQGLYDDMNNIDRKKLIEVWGPKLQDSRSFSTRIVHHAELSFKAKKKARLKEGQTTFNTPEKTEIYIQSYLNCIDP